MGTSSGQARPQARRGTAARAGALLLAATTMLALCVAGALASSGTDAGAVQGLSQQGDPPTSAEAKRWGAEFLRGEGAAKAVPAAPPGKAPGKRLFPQNRVLSLYGAAGGFGVIGRKSVKGAGKKLRRQLQPYRRRSGERVIAAFDLVAVIATQCRNRRDKCRVRVDNSVINKYLKKIRDLNGRLILDIQPGRADVIDEIKHLAPFIREPNVDVAIDAEWNVGPHGEPGEDLGTLRAKKLNRATKKIRKIIAGHDLPPKLLIVHQFRKDSVRGERNVNRPRKVDVTLNFDGIGSPSAKRAGYRDLSSKKLFNGFSLFYKLDSPLMKPKGVLGLNPKPDYVMYQ